MPFSGMNNVMNLLDKKAIGYANSIVAMINAGINDAASYRLAIDSIFCHVYGHVTKNDQRALSKYNKTSELSKSALLNPADKRVVEHIVPITVIYFEITALLEKERTAENIIKIITKMYKVRRVTEEEDLMLSRAGLQSSMPDEFYDVGHKLYRDLESRHIKVGIQA
ncbi:hypothetical protein L4C31_23070 [Aliivibrio sifiae]